MCEKYANGTLRLTTRQSIQFHGVLKRDLKSTIAGFNHALVTSLGGCGDVNRNVMACPAPLPGAARKQMQELADAVATHLAPKAGTGAYHEIWLNGEKQTAPAEAPDVPPADAPPEVAEPIYGKLYLPRKFKVGFSLPDDNCIDILAQCLGFLCVTENGVPVGYNVYVGGGQGRTNSREDTFAYPAACLGFVTPEEVVAASEAVIKLYRDHGNRSRPASGRASSTSSPTGASTSSAMSSSATTGRSRSRRRRTRRSRTSTCTSAGTARATASGSSA